MDGISSLTNVGSQDLKRNLDVTWLNHQAIANNIANANTPNFQGTHIVDTNPQLIQNLELTRTNPAHLSPSPDAALSGIKAEAVKDVSLDTEMGEMNKNNLFYQTLLEAVERKDHMAR